MDLKDESDRNKAGDEANDEKHEHAAKEQQLPVYAPRPAATGITEEQREKRRVKARQSYRKKDKEIHELEKKVAINTLKKHWNKFIFNEEIEKRKHKIRKHEKLREMKAKFIEHCKDEEFLTCDLVEDAAKIIEQHIEATTKSLPNAENGTFKS